MKKLIAGIVMSALLFMALAVPAVAGNKWGNRPGDGSSAGSESGANEGYCGGKNMSKYWYEIYC
ncbi:MAG: hypothetical protein ACKOKE_02880 [Actinomycetota bacterium]